MGCESNAHQSVWGSINCNSKGEILNQGDKPTFCSAGSLDVIDNAVGALGLLVIIIGWDVSSELSMSDHTHILYTLRGSVPVSLIRDPRVTNWAPLNGT